MQFATFNAVCDVELGDAVKLTSGVVTEITDIRTIHYLKKHLVEFEFELAIAPGIWVSRCSFAYPVPPVSTHADWVLPETTPEMCSNCMREVEIPANKPSKCPECGDEILPCSTCYDEIDGKKACDWQEEAGCWRFPKSDGAIEIHPDGSRCPDVITKMHQDGTLCEQCGGYLGGAVGEARLCVGCED